MEAVESKHFVVTLVHKGKHGLNARCSAQTGQWTICERESKQS